MVTHGELWLSPGPRHSPAAQTAAPQRSGRAEATAADHRSPALTRQTHFSKAGTGRAAGRVLVLPEPGGTAGAMAWGLGVRSCPLTLSFPLLNIPAQRILCI